VLSQYAIRAGDKRGGAITARQPLKNDRYQSQ
jgi:hypothetical protein